MAISYYDDAIKDKLKRWFPVSDNKGDWRILKNDEITTLLATRADDTNDSPIELPLLSITRSKDLELGLNIKNARSYNGIKLFYDKNKEKTVILNIIPIKVSYQLDIFTKTQEQGEEYVRELLFKLINNPKIIITIPYQGLYIQHVAYLRVLSSIADTSDVSERLFRGQFTRWTIQLELMDGFLFDIPYKNNWTFGGFGVETDNVAPEKTLPFLTDKHEEFTAGVAIIDNNKTPNKISKDLMLPYNK